MKDKTKAPMHTNLENYDDDTVRQAALDHLVLLLHKVALSTAAEVLRLNVPTLTRILDTDLPLEAIKVITARYIVFMCEANAKVLRILDDNPRGTAYYKHGE